MKQFPLLLGALFLVFLGSAWSKTAGTGPRKHPPESVSLDTGSALGNTGQTQAVESIHRPPTPRWMEDPRAALAVQAAGRGTPWVNFLDGRQVPTEYAGMEELAQSLRDRAARPKGLASADFDEDGVPDLLAAYDAGDERSGGLMVFHRGNVDAIYPYSPEARGRKAKGTFTDAPFLPEASVVPLPVKPKFVGAGDFDADGHWDVVAVAEGQDTLAWLPGDGKGGFGEARTLALPGRATAFATGDVNRRDGLTDVIVGVSGPAGHRLLVFEGPEGALAREPEAFVLPAPATSVGVGRIDETDWIDLTVAAGKSLVVIHGRDRRLTSDEGRRAKVSPALTEGVELDFEIAALAFGTFDADLERDLALLSVAGDLYQVPVRFWRESIRKGADPSKSLGEPHLRGSGAKAIIPVKSSSRPGEDLLLLDRGGRKLELVMPSEPVAAQDVERAAPETGGSAMGAERPEPPARPERPRAGLSALGTPVAVLPMRLGTDGLSDLVLLSDKPVTLSVLPTLPMNLYVVTSHIDPGDGACNSDCTLREAINAANVSLGSDEIDFSMPLNIINLATELPGITGAMTLNGRTQPGFGSTPLVTLNGGLLTSTSSSALRLSGGSNTVLGMAFADFGDPDGADGSATIVVDPAGTGGSNILENNFVGLDGLDGTGSTARPGRIGIAIHSDNNRIGGTVPIARNVISGNSDRGLQIFATASYNLIQGNFIGTNATGSAALENYDFGIVVLDGADNTIGGTTAGAGNVISGNGGSGVAIGATPLLGTVPTLIQGNLIGPDVTGSFVVQENYWGIQCFVDAVTIGGTTPAARNVIAGSSGTPESGGIGIDIRNRGVGGNLVQGNFIGTNGLGTGSLPNRTGVHVSGATNTIGGSVAGARNVISANIEAGVTIVGLDAIGNQVQGNYIGTDASGTAALPNADSPGSVAIEISVDSSSNMIGGTTPAERNLISGNGYAGVGVFGESNTVAGNYIGTDVSGNSALPNVIGVWLGGLNNVIGVPSAGNVISGNLEYGIYIIESGDRVSNNLIGLAADGTSALGNLSHGVFLGDGASGNVVGGTSAADQNSIAFNGGGGIAAYATAGNGNAFLINSIFSNGGLGIDLDPAGVNVNDPGDGDGGPNNRQNHPELTLVETTGGSLHVVGTLDSLDSSTFTIHVYHSPSCDPSGYGEGKTHLGQFAVSTNSVGLASFDQTITGVAVFGGAITTTADFAGDTSEFSACSSVAGVPPLPVTGLRFDLGPESLGWDPALGAIVYHLYAGTRLTMPALASQSADSCEAVQLPDPGFVLPPAGDPPPGHVLWVLVTPENQFGEGTVQPGSNGPRVLTSTGECGDSCAHDRCDVGAPLVPACDPCASIVCDKDPACCTTDWTAACVQEVRTVCRNLNCPESQGQCAHELCQSGGSPLVPGCDVPPLATSCVAAVCQADPHCCQQTWDDACLDRMAKLCKYNCL